jgi:DNA-binding transcriptional LysR family regulator
MIFDLVSQGLGISFATTYVCDHFKRDDVVKVPLDDDYDYEVCAVQKYSTSENKDLIDFIRKHLES